MVSNSYAILKKKKNKTTNKTPKENQTHRTKSPSF